MVSESSSWVNGQRSAQLQLGLVVIPQHAGTFTIPSIKVKVDGQEAATVPLTMLMGQKFEERTDHLIAVRTKA